MYSLEFGESEGTLIKRAREMNGPLPDRILNAPELQLGLDLYYAAFWTLCSERPVGMGPGAIPWFSMYRYADIHNLDEDTFEDLEYIIRKMDEAYLAYMQKQSESKRESDKAMAERRPIKNRRV